MKRLSSCACLLASLSLWQATARAEDKPPFTCTISSTATTLTEGKAPDIQVTIRNESGKEAILVGSLDGTSLGSRRYPQCGFEVFDPAGKPVELKVLGGCANQNRLQATDFVTVAAGADFNPFTKGLFFRSADPIRMAFLPSGTYRVRFLYRTSNGDIRDYMGDEREQGAAAADPELKKLHQAVPVLDLKSNDLTFTIVPRKAVPGGAKPAGR